MKKRLLSLFLVMVPVFLVGCSVGPAMMRANRITYNDALQFTERQELLLNIVRLRYNEGPEFLATSSISTQFTIDLGASADANVGDDQQQRTALLDLGGSVGYSEKPTITFTPRNEKEFSRQLISPVELEIIYLLVNYGWDIDRVLKLTTNGINGLRNDTIREDPSEGYDRHLRQFAGTVERLGRLQAFGMVELSVESEEDDASGPIHEDKVNLSDILEATQKNYRLVFEAASRTYRLKSVKQRLTIQFSRHVFEQMDFQKLTRDLRLPSDTLSFRLINSPGSQIKVAETSQLFTDLLVSTRSVLGTMAYLSQGVLVPEKHIQTGKVAYSRRHASSHESLSDLFNVRVREEKPNNAGLAIPYKGFWFYIEDNDLSSKRTLGVLNSLVRLKIQAAGVQNNPVLTLPVGN